MTKCRPLSYAAKDIVNNIIEKKIVILQYQRRQVWNLKQEKKFINSIKKGILLEHCYYMKTKIKHIILSMVFNEAPLSLST